MTEVFSSAIEVGGGLGGWGAVLNGWVGWVGG